MDKQRLADVALVLAAVLRRNHPGAEPHASGICFDTIAQERDGLVMALAIVRDLLYEGMKHGHAESCPVALAAEAGLTGADMGASVVCNCQQLVSDDGDICNEEHGA